MKKSDNIFAGLWNNNAAFRDAVIIAVSAVFVLIIAISFNISDLLIKLLDSAPAYNLNEIFIVSIFLAIASMIFGYRRWRDYKSEVLERKNAEYRMQKSRTQLQAVHDGIPDVIIQVDRNMRILWANRAALEINQYAIGKRSFSAFSYTEGTFIDSYCKWAMEMKRIEKGIKYSPMMTGTPDDSYWECIAVPLKDKDDEVFGAIAIARNVSQRMRTEHTWNLLASIVESSNDAIYGVSMDGIILNWNPGAEKTYGYSAGEIVGKNISIMLPPDRRNEFSDKIEKVMRKKVVERFESIRIRKDKSEIFITLTLCPFLDATGRKIGVSTIERDITLRRKAQLALQESEERYKSFVLNFKGIAFRSATDYKPVFIHGAVEDITGYTANDFLEGRINWDLIIYDEDREVLLQHPNYKPDVPSADTDLEYRIVRKDGTVIWVQEHSQNIFDDAGNLHFIQGTVHNVDQRKQAEIGLKNSREQFRNLAIHLDTVREEERKQIAFEIHDELGYALTAMKLDLSWLNKKIPGGQPQLNERMREMGELIDSTIKKIRSISTQLRPSILDHFGLVAAMEWQAKEFQKRSAIRCNFNVDADEIRFDDKFSIAVFRILQEALTNIARYAKATRVDVNLIIKSNLLSLTVEDNGIGIKSEQLGKRKTFGLLGMRERANFMGGDLDISGVPDVGTKIQLIVPIKSDAQIKLTEVNSG